jgi:hypothetical protein
MDWRGTMKGVRGSRNKPYTLIAIDTVLGCMSQHFPSVAQAAMTFVEYAIT